MKKNIIKNAIHLVIICGKAMSTDNRWEKIEQGYHKENDTSHGWEMTKSKYMRKEERYQMKMMVDIGGKITGSK